MAVITKGASGLVLTTAANWVGGVAPGAADVARWASTSSSGNHTGSLTLLGLKIDGAAGQIGYSSGTLTLTQTDAVVFGTSNTQKLAVAGGVLAFGSGAKNVKLFRLGGAEAIGFDTTGSLTGSGTLTFTSAGLDTTQHRVALGFPYAGFTGTIVLGDYVSMVAYNASQTVLSSANVTVAGEGCTILASVSGVTFGASGRTLTINRDVSLGFSAQSLAIASSVVLAGDGTRTLTVNGNITMSGTVTGTAGLSMLSVSEFTFLSLTGSTAGFSGPLTISGGSLLNNSTARLSLSALDIASGGRYYDRSETADFTWNVTPTGAGILAIRGNYAGNGVTFPASPTAGNIAGFNGSVTATVSTQAGLQSSKIIISELPGKLGFTISSSAASPLATAQITYNGAGATSSTGIVVDSDNSANSTGLNNSTFALLSSGSGPIVLSGPVQRLNSNFGATPPASARMSLTLGGSNTGDNTLSGNTSEFSSTANLGISKVDAGRWVLSGNNSHTGVHTISAGTLAANSATALGSATSTGGVSITGTGVLELGDGVTLNKSVTDFSLGNATNPVQTAGTSTLQSKQVTLSVTPTFTVPSGRKLTIAPQGAGIIVGSGTGITKAGDGELELTATANTFNGALTVSAGTLTVGSVANVTPSLLPAAWGQTSSAVLVSGTLKYNGGVGSSNRAVQMTGSAPTLDASGSGALTLSNVTQDTTAKTMTLRGTSTDANTISSAIANNTGAVSLAKEDAGRWVLSGALSYTGTTVVNGGTLRVETGNSNTTSGAVTIGASGIVELITGTLASAGATSGEVLGTGNVTVNGGTIKTRGGSTQQGQVRYGGNLTFGSGSSLYIGAAA